MLRLPSRQSVCSSCQLLLKVLQFSPHSRTLRSGIPVSQCLLMFSCLRCRAELSLQLCGIISLAFPLLALFTFTLATQKPQSPRTISKPRHHTHAPYPHTPIPDAISSPGKPQATGPTYHRTSRTMFWYLYLLFIPCKGTGRGIPGIPS